MQILIVKCSYLDNVYSPQNADEYSGTSKIDPELKQANMCNV